MLVVNQVGGFGRAPVIFSAGLAFGDSITEGYSATNRATDAWVPLLAAELGLTITNYGTSGDMVPDQTDDVYSNTPLTSSVFATIDLGTNDERFYGVNATKLGYYSTGLQALIARLACGTVQNALTNGVYTGTWANTVVHGSIGKNSLTNGSKVTFTVSGTAIYIAAIRQNSNTGTADVKIDGVSVGTISTTATAMDTVNGQTFGPQLLRFSGLSAGSHTVEITVTSSTGAGKNVYIDWVGGNDQTIKPHVFAGNVIYAKTYPSGGSGTNVDSYNVAVAAKIAELVADGLNVHAVNWNTALNQTTDMDADYHPVDAGHVKIKNVMLAAVQSA